MGQDTDIIRQRRAPVLYGIAAFKLGKGLFFVLVALGLYTLSDNDLPAEFREIVRWLHLDPEREFFVNIFKKLQRVTEANVLWVAGGTVAYAALALVEGVGLLLRHSWAAYLAIAESAFFIPVEIFKLSQHVTWGLVFITLINILIVWYLFANRHRLFRHHHAQQEPRLPET